MKTQNFNNKSIGQVAGRDVSNVSKSGDSLVNNNVLNINVRDEVSEESITEFQRKRIANKVEAVMKADNVGRLEVYAELLDEYNIREIRALPSSKYKTVLVKLDRWLERAKTHANEQSKIAIVTQSEATKNDQPPPKTLSCAHCSAARSKLAAARLALAGFVLLFATATATAGYLWFKGPDMQQVEAPNAISTDVCHYAGQPYSLGSMITADKQKLTCVSTAESPTWKEYATSLAEKKPPRPKRPEKRVLSAEQPQVTPSSEASPIAASQ